MRPEKAVSIMFHPLLVLPVSAFLYLNLSGLAMQESLYWLVLWVTISLLPTTIVVWRIGGSGLEVPRQSDRLKPFLAAVLSLSFSLLVFSIISAPGVVMNLGLTGVFAISVFGLANFVDKVSVHTGSMAAVAVLFSTLSVTSGFFLFLVSVLVGWSRLKLDRHETIQVVQGGFLGLVSGIVFIIL